MHQLGGFFAKPRPFLPGDFVTTDAGTGLVHMAPDHGEDDFLLCKAQRHRSGLRGRRTTAAIARTGRGSAARAASSTRSSTRRTGRSAPTCARPARLLAASADFRTVYPHSWRSKAKVIFRCTPQWFIPMDAVAGTPVDSLGTSESGGGAQDSIVPSEVEAARLERQCSRPSARLALDAIEAHALGARALARTASARWSRAGPTG